MHTEYLSIGKVAKLKNTSIKALRYYDEIEIFVPAYINPKTNYRYYTTKQLPMLDAVNLCLKLGIPLKTLPAYINDGFFDFNALLSDTRRLAEEKIQGIHLALDKIQCTCQAVAAPSSPLKINFPDDEYLAALPLSESQLPPYDGFVLQLFIFARQHNLILENPSCILYRFENSCWNKYICLKLRTDEDIIPKEKISSFAGTDFSLFKIPAGTFTKRLRTKAIEYPARDSVTVFGNADGGYVLSLLERMITNAGTDNECRFELIELQTINCN